MDKMENLKAKASALQRLLQLYAARDGNAEMVLGFMTPLFEDIRAGKVVPPHKHEYRWHFANTESPLFKYDDLCQAAAEYGHALEDWNIEAHSK